MLFAAPQAPHEQVRFSKSVWLLGGLPVLSVLARSRICIPEPMSTTNFRVALRLYPK